MKVFLTQKNIIILFAFFAAFYLITTILRGINHYTPVPYADMWDGYINFYIRASQGDLNAWWVQHNEHRLVLSKVLFWLDLNFFKGRGIFLIIINYSLAALGFYILYKILQERLPESQDQFTRNVFALTIFCLSFSWLQSSNFYWAFQNQFFLAQTLPLAAFFLLYKSYATKTQALNYFIFACLLGVAAMGTMANGVVALPLMVILALMLRMRAWQIGILFLLALLTVGFYFHDYVSPPNHSSLFHTLSNDPLGLLEYMFLYLGSPFDVLFNRFIIMLTGILLLVCALGFTWQALKKHAALELMLLTFILYIGGAALATAGGRLLLGVDYALAGRYTTPALMAWSVLLILFAPMIAKQARIDWQRILPLLFIPLLFLPAQFKSMHSTHDKLINREVAILALELGIPDDTQLAFLYPRPEHVLSLGKIAAENDLSVFGSAPFNNLLKLMGQKRPALTRPCQGYLDEPFVIANSHYVRISGWLFNPANKTIPPLVYILNEQHLIVGVALTGLEREDAKSLLGKKAEDSGFKGYLLVENLGQTIILHGTKNCELPVTFQ